MREREKNKNQFHFIECLFCLFLCSIFKSQFSNANKNISFYQNKIQTNCYSIIIIIKSNQTISFNFIINYKWITVLVISALW